MSKRRVQSKFFLIAMLCIGILKLTTAVYAAKAGFVGNEICKECHGDVVKAFTTNIHNKADRYGYRDAGCETCHGTAGDHVVSGDIDAIVNPMKLPYEEASATCLTCHAKGKSQMYWHGSIHQSQGVACTGCHKVHGGNAKLLAKPYENDLCLGCHVMLRADLLKRSKHPMRDASTPSGEGKMTCSSCHNSHGASAEKLISAKSFNDKCYECHFEKKAPVLWEHSPVKEDCLTCHNAHGSSNDKMLVTKIPRLCQQCHMQGRHQTGALGMNSTYAFNRSCLNCHSMVHGSNNPSGAVLQR